MDEFTKEMLLAFMTITLKLNEKDPTVASDIEYLNTFPDTLYGTNSAYGALESTIIRGTQLKGDDYLKFVEQYLDSMTFLDIEYIRHMIQLRKLEKSFTAETIRAQLVKEVPRFRTAEHDYEYYHGISTMAIVLNDSQLIQQTIDKVQSL